VPTGSRLSLGASLIALAACACGNPKTPLVNGTGTTGGTTLGTTTSGSGTTGGSTSSGSSTAGSSSTSAGSTGGTTGGNIYLAAFYELIACGGTQPGCPAPLGCTAGGSCELPCRNDLDCPNPQTHCVDAGCEANACGGSGLPFYGPCDALDAGDGTCLQFPPSETFVLNRGPQFACARPGTATTSCLWPSALSTPATTCPRGETCDSLANFLVRWVEPTPFGTCRPVCDGFDAGECPAGFECVSELPPNHWHPYCLPLDGGLACPLGPIAAEYAQCASTADGGDCGCGYVCRVDPGFFGIPQCEQRCTHDEECPSVADHCIAGYCQPRFCAYNAAQQPIPGTLGGPCPLGGDAGNGTCTAISTYGACVPAGTSTTACDPSFTQTNPSVLCAAGDSCVLQGVCGPGCDATDPDGGGGCPSGVACVAGACLGACSPSGTFCQESGECCSGCCSRSCGTFTIYPTCQ
jgi:hypothetical protein